ncbi:methyltransferase domain-containing protein [Saccharothrix sp. S26]|uniref:methyltransferase domain-containing protein n=1 Tax=Saccharothrix sp. S26 TaxID=2907215 RepID=UPI001F279EF0|nr:methyltransferase domain-containing protein [Saccharothrix sp. S26]MCE6996833.1 methyltransferase domain-containing protein [Saccharothrix sp. S26]
MESEFWFDSWEQGGTKTSFHLRDVHEHARMLARLGLVAGARVLVPLCGKTTDLRFFAESAAEVVGVELVPRAVAEFFAENGLDPVLEEPDVFRCGNLVIRRQDIFKLGPAEIGPVDLVYDRASLIAFPDDMRQRYAETITRLVRPGTRYFINTLEYHPRLPSPPFSVGPREVVELFGHAFEVEHVAAEPRPEHRMVEKFGLTGLVEHGFLLRAR